MKEADLIGTFSCSIMWGSTDFKMQSLRWRVVPAMRLTRHMAITPLKCQNDFTTASSRDKKDEGEVEASSTIREARNFDLHMFKEKEPSCLKILLLSKKVSL